MISVINGYICTSSCEVAEAKHGKDPQAPAGLPAGAAGQDEKTSAFSERPATVLGGALKELAGIDGIFAGSDKHKPSLDRLA